MIVSRCATIIEHLFFSGNPHIVPPDRSCETTRRIRRWRKRRQGIRKASHHDPAPALAQDATPIAGNQAGLGAWSEQLSTLSPDEINRLLLEKPVEPAGYADNIVAVSTDFSADPDWPFPDRPVHEVSLGFEPIDDDREFEIGTGIFLVFADAATAASNLLSIEPGQSGDTTIWAVPFAGLEGRWVTSNRSSAIYLQAGPVILVGTDEFMTDGAYVHLMSSISNVLRNIDHVLTHLFKATDQELDLD